MKLSGYAFSLLLLALATLVPACSDTLPLEVTPPPPPDPPGPSCFTDGPRMAYPRAGAVAVALDGGRVLIVGGGAAPAETYDATADQFVAAGSVDSGPVVAAARRPDGSVLVLASSPSASQSLLLSYDPVGATFSTLTTTPMY